MSDNYILDKDGKPIPCDDLLEWGRWMQVSDRIVQVSTIFLGLNHNFYYSDNLVLYETMIFGGKHDGYQERYATREEALEGHAKALKIAKG
jgi:hypothetical protein